MLLPFAREQNKLKMVSPDFWRIIFSIISCLIIGFDTTQLN